MANVKRATLCECGHDWFEKSYDTSAENPSDWRPLWRCTNCLKETPRKTHARRTNRARAFAAYQQIKDEWKPVDAQLDALVASGKAKSGCLLVHTSTFDFYLESLMTLEKPSNFEVKYHAGQARLELAKAKAFVAEISQQSAA